VRAVEKDQRRTRLHIAALAGCLLLYLAISLRNLEVIPTVYEDEPWLASTGLKMATRGIFGSDMFAGFYGMESHYYGYMPLHPSLLAVTYRLIGFGLFQTRLEPVMMGLLALALTYALGRRLFGPDVGLLAVGLMLFTRFTAITPSHLTGILLLDVARIARYDIMVPVFGLASLHAYVSARKRADARLYTLAGLLAGLSGLTHVYGAFWIVALAILAVWDRAARRALVALAIGFVAPWLVYLVYVLENPADWAGQMRGYAPRFDLLNPAWYWDNLRNEYLRYAPGIDSIQQVATRPGLALITVVWPAALFALFSRAIRLSDRAARTLAVPALVMPASFALLLYIKMSNYLIAVLPLGALVVAWGLVSLWQWAGCAWQAFASRWMQLAVAGLSCAVFAEGVARIGMLESLAATTTPYPEFIARVRAFVPHDARVLGLHNYWLGLHDLDYRTWLVPVLQADARSACVPLPVEAALDGVAPDMVLIDPHMRAYLNDPGAGDPVGGIRDWMERQHLVRIGVVDDGTYGLIEILARPGVSEQDSP
jgi:4-amino-4-deoxy-L-arabinose transferase-like glycosyltransferase